MEEFEKKNVFERSKMNLDELTEYYKLLRKYEYETGVPIDKGLMVRKAIHPVLLNAIKLSRKIEGKNLTILVDESTPTDRPVIYASNHIGRFDVEMCFEALKNHAYLFLGDPRDIYQSYVGLILYLNGMIALETDDKPDRFIAKERAIELLNKNGSILIYPEGAWNLTAEKIIVPIYSGTVEMAIKSNAIIVPMAIEQYGQDYVVNIGKNIDLSGKDLKDKSILSEDLRNTLATLRWQIWETTDTVKRSDIPDDYFSTYVKNIMDESEFIYTADDAFNSYYRPKDQTSPEEAFAFMKKLVPSKNNAFLLKK